MTENDEIEVISRRMRTVPELDQLNVFLSLKQTGEASHVTINYHTDRDEAMWVELIIKTTPEKKDQVLKILDEWETKGLI